MELYMLIFVTVTPTSYLKQDIEMHTKPGYVKMTEDKMRKKLLAEQV